MIKRVEDILNDVFKFEVSKKYIDRFTIFIVYISMFFMIIPKYVIEVTGINIGENIFYSIYFIFLIPYLYILIYNIKHKYFKISLDFILLSLYLFIAFLSAIFSNNFFNSILGSYGRRDGFLTLIMYILIYLDSKNINDKNDVIKIIKIFMIYAILSTFYSFIQVYLPVNIYSIKYYGHMGYGFQGNPNFFGTYTLLFTLLGLFISLFISDKKFYKISTIIIYCGLIMAESSGPFFTFILMFIGLFIYVLIKRSDLIKKIFMWLLIFISLYGLVNYSLIYVNKDIYNIEIETHSTLSGDINSIIDIVFGKFKNEKLDKEVVGDENVLPSSNNQDDNVDIISSNRLSIQDEVIKYIKRDNHIWFGSGIDNLDIYYVQFIEGNALHYWVIDKAHNIYLNIIAETGIFSFIVYLSWMIVLIVHGIKSKNKYVYLLLFGLIGYNIQGIFNINVIYVMPYYYIISGMMMGLIEGDRHESRKH